MEIEKKLRVKRLAAGIVLSVIIVSCLAIAMGNTVYAGFGDYNSYSNSGSSNDSDPSAVAFFIKVVLVAVLIIACIIAAIADSIKKKIKPDHKSEDLEKAAPSDTNNDQAAALVYAKDGRLPDRTHQIDSIIKEHDPDFTAPEFISFVKQVYMDIQNAWADRDLRPVMAVLHQNLYQMTEKQIQAKIRDGIVNHLERISVNAAYLSSYKRDSQYEYVGVYLASSMVDYQVQEATGKVILGDKRTRWDMNYKMMFMRSLNVKTKKAEDKNMGHVCPCCGAPIKGTSFGKCEYCGAVVTTGMYSWVLCNFELIKNDTIDEGIRGT